MLQCIVQIIVEESIIIGINMLNGIYLNLKDDRGDLLYFDGNTFHFNDNLTYDDFDVNIELDLELQKLEMTFINLEYLGDL
jgi:hypothetical protein